MNFQLDSAQLKLDDISLYFPLFVVTGDLNIYWICLGIKDYYLQSRFLYTKGFPCQMMQTKGAGSKRS